MPDWNHNEYYHRLLFRSGNGGPLQETTYGSVWRRARKKALTPAQAASPFAGRPYDLRHAAASLWLNAGVPATEVARRLGHSVAMLLKVYAGCLDGQEETANARIGAALQETGYDTLRSVSDATEEPGTGGHGPCAGQDEDSDLGS